MKELWDVMLLERRDDDTVVGVNEDYGDEQWLASRRQMLGRKVEEIKKESAKLTTAKIIGLIPDSEISMLCRTLTRPVPLEDFVSILTTAILKDERVAFPEDELRACIEELFFLIDVNGSGSLDWSELTHYIVHSYEARKESMNSHQPWTELSRYACPAERCKKRKIFYFPSCDKTFTIDSCHTTAMSDHSVLSVYLPNHGSHSIKPYGTIKSECSFEDAEWLPSFNQLVVSSADGLLKWYTIRDPKDKTRSDPIRLTKHVYVEGMQLRICLDSETGLLFTGNNRGELFGLQPDDTPNEMPETIFRARPHLPHPVVDLLPLPTIGAKKVVSCGLDSKCYINDVSTGTIERELVRENERDFIRSLSYSPEYALLATSGCYDPEPTLWTPLAGQFISKLRDIDAPHKGSIIGVHCVQQNETGGNMCLQPWHLLSADSLGMLKVWDIRKVMVLQTFWLDPSVGDVAARLGVQDSTLADNVEQKAKQQLNVYDVAVDPSRGWLLSACRTDTERITMVHRQVLFKHKNAYVAHDESVSCVLYNAPAGCFLTTSGCSVRVWDALTGSVRETYSDITRSHITAVAIDGNSRRFMLGCHDGQVTVHALATGGIATTFQKAPAEVTGIFEVPPDLVIVIAGLHLLGYRGVDGAENAEKPPMISIKVQDPQLCFAKCPELNMFAVGDTTETITIYDTYSISKVKALASVKYQRAREEREEVAEVDPNQATEQQIRHYMHPKVNEIACVVVANPYPLLVASDYGGYLTMWTLRPHRKPYQPCGRGKMHKYHRAASTPVVTCMVTQGKKLFTGDDHGCFTIWNMKPIISSWSLEPATFPCPEYKTDDLSVESPDIAQATVMNCISAHQRMTPVSDLAFVKEISGFITCGGDCNVYLWDIAGEKVGKLEQGRQFKEDDVGSIPVDYIAAHGLFLQAQDSDKLRGRRRSVSHVSCASSDASERTEEQTSIGSSSEADAEDQVVCKGNLAVVTAEYYASLFPRDEAWRPSGDGRQQPPFMLDEYQKPPPGRHATFTPPPTPNKGKKLKNRFITTTKYSQYHRESTPFRKRVEKPPKEVVKQRKGIFEVPPAIIEVRRRMEAVHGTLKGVLSGKFTVAFFRKPKLAVYDVPAIPAALRSLPSTEQKWKNMLPGIDTWVTKNVKNFVPFEVCTLSECKWLGADESDDEPEEVVIVKEVVATPVHAPVMPMTCKKSFREMVVDTPVSRLLTRDDNTAALLEATNLLLSNGDATKDAKDTKDTKDIRVSSAPPPQIPPTPSAVASLEAPAMQRMPSWKFGTRPATADGSIWNWNGSIPCENCPTDEAVRELTRVSKIEPVPVPTLSLPRARRQSVVAGASFCLRAAREYSLPRLEIGAETEDDSSENYSVEDANRVEEEEEEKEKQEKEEEDEEEKEEEKEEGALVVAQDQPASETPLLIQSLKHDLLEVQKMQALTTPAPKKWKKAPVQYRSPPLSRLNPLCNTHASGLLPATVFNKHRVRSDLDPVLHMANRHTVWLTRRPPQRPPTGDTLINRLAHGSAGEISPLLKSLALKLELSGTYNKPSDCDKDVLVYRPLSADAENSSGASVIISSRPTSAAGK